jgi:hypothetical protein
VSGEFKDFFRTPDDMLIVLKVFSRCQEQRLRCIIFALKI